jgi:DNA primase
MNIKQAKEIPLEAVLRGLQAEETSAKADRSEIFYKSPVRQEKTGSFKIDTKKNAWFDFGTGKGGDIIKLAQELNGGTVSEALQWLKRFQGVTLPEIQKDAPRGRITAAKAKEKDETSELKRVKEKTITNPALCQYIGARGLPMALMREYCREISYKGENERIIYGIGFENDVQGWELRGAIGDFKANVNGKAISTIYPQEGQAETVHMFEGFTDFLTMQNKWPRGEKDAVIVLNGAAMAKAGIEKIKTDDRLKGAADVRLWFDNDATGDRITQETADELHTLHEVADMRQTYAGYKDLNEYWVKSPEAKRTADGIKTYDDTASASVKRLAERGSKPKF